MFDLKLFRKDKKISQTKLAEILGVGQSFISQIESGKDPMPEAFIIKLSEIYPTDNIRSYAKKDDIEFKIKEADAFDIATMGGEVYANLLNKLIRDKQLAPFALLEQKEQEIKELNREIGRLEERLENSKKTDAQERGDATCAVAK